MHYYDAEGEYNPIYSSGPQAGALPVDEHDCSRNSWGGLLDEANTAIRTTLEEIALLASTVTADTLTTGHPHVPASPIRSAYSLLLDPALFKLPA
jgi:hypothetical protein